MRNNTRGAFNEDIIANEGYLYTTKASLSSFLANSRLTDAALAIVDFHGKRVLDIGCGDGSYTLELFDRGRPASMRGVDPAIEAIKVADAHKNLRQVVFDVAGADSLPYNSDSFDIAHIRGALHHMDNPKTALKEALRVATVIVIIEPNGYNPIVKLIEKLSGYHVRHRERSYLPLLLDRWLKDLGGEIVSRRFIGLVPFFCPDWMARFLKFIEPVIERIPLVNRIVCAVYVFVAERSVKYSDALK